MSATHTFRPRGPTVRLLAGPHSGLLPASAAARASRSSAQPYARDFLITNLGPVPVFLAWGADAATAVANATIPERGASQSCRVVLPGQCGIEADPDSYFAAVTEAGEADVFVLPGIGEVNEIGYDAVQTQAMAASLGLMALIMRANRETLTNLLVEARTQTAFLKSGLGVADEPDAVRADQVVN